MPTFVTEFGGSTVSGEATGSEVEEPQLRMLHTQSEDPVMAPIPQQGPGGPNPSVCEEWSWDSLSEIGATGSLTEAQFPVDDTQFPGADPQPALRMSIQTGRGGSVTPTSFPQATIGP